MSNNLIISNIVKKDDLRRVQRNTLNDIASYLITSFGPFGSNSIIKAGPDAATVYTKDGHDILSKIKYNGAIESTILDDLVDITKYVVKTVGDGTTSAVEMSNLIFQKIADLEATGKYTSHDIVSSFKRIVELISNEIRAHGAVCSDVDLYNIALTSTNDDSRLANNLAKIYMSYGLDTYINLQVATGSAEDIIKVYDGVTLQAGFTDAVFANKPGNVCELPSPHIYFFEDPVDTPEMINLFDKIISENIYKAYSESNADGSIKPIPTVIIAPRISGDMSGFFTQLTKAMMKFEPAQRPPLAVITAYGKDDEVSDIAKLCGANMIRKYINPDIQAKDIEAGLAPSLDTVTSFYGTCDSIVIDSEITKLINPKLLMEDIEEGTFTDTAKNLINWLEGEIERCETNNDSTEKYKLKNRLHAITRNMVDYFVGGISVADRDSNRALLEDAIKNCNAAVANGVGFGANFEGLRASHILLDRIKEAPDSSTQDKEIDITTCSIIYDAYREISKMLYSSVVSGETELEELVDKSIEQGSPYNLRTKSFDRKIMSAITSDIVILEAISKIITLMATANQFILPTPNHNVYQNISD